MDRRRKYDKLCKFAKFVGRELNVELDVRDSGYVVLTYSTPVDVFSKKGKMISFSRVYSPEGRYEYYKCYSGYWYDMSSFIPILLEESPLKRL